MMSEAITDIPAIPGMNVLEGVNTRRHSTGKVMMSNGGLTVLSRYLRASQGSCHDICKYGTGFTTETESRSPRIPIPKIVTPKRAGTNRTLEKTKSNLGERGKNSDVSLKLYPDSKVREPNDPVVIKIVQTQGRQHVENAEANLTDSQKSGIGVIRSGYTEPHKLDSPVVSLKPSVDDMVDIKTIAAEGEAEDEENIETKLSTGEKKPEVSLKPSPDSKNQKPFDPVGIESEVSSLTDKEFVSPKNVALPLKGTDVAVADARAAKLMPQAEPSSLLRQTCSGGKHNTKGSKSEETKLMSMTPGLSGKSNDEMAMRKEIRTSVMGDQENVAAPSVSLLHKESSTIVSSMNAKKKKSRGVCHSKKQEIGKQIEHEKSCSKNAKQSKNQKGVSHLMDQENVKQPNSEESSFANIPEKTLRIIESNPENKPAERIQNSVHDSDFSKIPSSSSKDKSMKQTRNRIPTGQSPRSYKKWNMIHRPNGIRVRGLPPSLSSFHGEKGLRSTPYGLNVTQPSLTSSTSLTSSKSPYGGALSQHDEGKSSRSCRKNMIHRPKGIHALGLLPSLSSFPGKKGLRSTPYGLNVTQPSLTSSSSFISSKSSYGGVLSHHDEVAARKETGSSKLMYNSKRNMALITTSKNKHYRGEKLNFQRGKVIEVPLEDCTPRRLAFKQRVLIDDRNGDNGNKKVEDYAPKRLNFRQRVFADNRNEDNRNEGQEFAPRRLKFRRRVFVDNRNADNRNDRGENCTPRTLKLWRRVLDDKNIGCIQNNESGTSKNNSEGIASQDNAAAVQSDKISLRHNHVEEKKDSGSLYNSMIEETATRLVRTKTRKVKALVSAFESVISHLDTRISAKSNIC